MAPGEPEHEAARLYDSFGASLYRYALMMLASREAAEDVIQQVFVALLQQRRLRLDDPERYLRRAVRNACYSALRQKKVRGTTTHQELFELAAPEGADVSREDRLALGAAVRGLPPEQREVVHLHIFEGRTFKEIAEATGDPMNTVASRYRYALEKLRVSMTEST
jgi:RNA polymerase sigma-70 factor (ECF subfamily)